MLTIYIVSYLFIIAFKAENLPLRTTLAESPSFDMYTFIVVYCRYSAFPV